MTKLRLFFIFCITIFALTLSASKTNAQSVDEIAVRQLLSKQTEAWNKGNLDSFMHGYWQSDSLVFIGKSGPKYGYKTTLENYKKSYPDAATMGKLEFTLLQMKGLSLQYYFVIGKWHLQRTAGDVEGHFTLLLKKIKKDWVIVADHSS